MTPHQQRLFIITEENLNKLVKNGVSKKSEEIAYLVKQCPYSPTPAVPFTPTEQALIDECLQTTEDIKATIRNQTLDELVELTEAATSDSGIHRGWVLFTVVKGIARTLKGESLRTQEHERGDAP